MYLELRNVSFSYGQNMILRDINFGINRGEITGLIGANGAGKTTTIYNMVKRLKPNHGKIFIDGKDIISIPRSGLEISYIPDEPVYYEELTLIEHLNFVQALYPENKIDINEIIRRLNLEEHLYKIPSMLSKGTLQKMLIAISMLRTHKLLIADEPFNGLDPQQINEFKSFLLEEKAQEKGVLISTHLLDLVEGLCDKYVMLDSGTILAYGTKSDIIREFDLNPNSTLEKVYLSLIKERM